MEENQIYIHFGLHKTGTTFFQREVFPKYDNIVFTSSKLFNEILATNKTKFLVSHEGLFGLPFTKNNTENPRYLENHLAAINKLSEFSAKVRIILSLRNHQDIIISLYKQYLHEGGTKNLEGEFFDINNQGVLKIEDLYFWDRIELIEELYNFKPLVYLYEELQKDPEKLIIKISNYLKEDPPPMEIIQFKKHNEGVKYHQANILRRMNQLMQILPKGQKLFNNYITHKLGITPRRLCQNKLKFISDKNIEFSSEYKKEINKLYEDDWNKVLEYIKG
jgi:hypothetical protein